MHVSVKEIQTRLLDDFDIDMQEYLIDRHCHDMLVKVRMVPMCRSVITGRASDYKLNIKNFQPYNIKAVIALYPEYLNYPSQTIQQIEYPPQLIFERPEEETTSSLLNQELNVIPHIKGPYIDYEWDGTCLKFNEESPEVAVEIVNLSLDKDGYLRIPEDLTDAAVHYCAFVHLRPLYLLGKIPQYVMRDIERWKSDAMISGKIGAYFKSLNKNAMNDILNYMTSFDRKSHNIDV